MAELTASSTCLKRCDTYPELLCDDNGDWCIPDSWCPEVVPDASWLIEELPERDVC